MLLAVLVVAACSSGAEHRSSAPTGSAPTGSAPAGSASGSMTAKAATPAPALPRSALPGSVEPAKSIGPVGTTKPAATATTSKTAPRVPPATTRAPAPTIAAQPAKPQLPVLPALPSDAYVDVAVATLWRSPTSPRAVDQPELRQPAGVRGWLASMTLAQRRALNGRVDSQLILGERVVVDRREAGWAHVVVPDQPSPLNARGYPGWIPVVQLAFRAPVQTQSFAVVTAPTAWLYAADAKTRLLEVSMATRLPVLAADPTWVRGQLPDGTAVLLQSAQVTVVAAGAAALAASGDDVVRTAQRFVGLPYLWGGMSGFGFDCSGFTHLLYEMRGITIPRDADAQATAGTPVARAALRPGDLVFFASNGVVHHVGIYVGNGAMLSALQTGSPVQVSSLSAQPFASEYSGARRYFG